jgi:hypothetical protein
MTRKLLLPTFLVLLTALSVVPPVLARDRYIHLAVDEYDGRGDQVRITLPYDLVESLFPLFHSRSLNAGRIRIEGVDCDGSDLRLIWSAVRERKEGEFVTVESGDETVHVMRKAGYLIVRTDERRGRSSRTDVRIPVPIVDALLSGDDDELDVAAAIRAMGRKGAGDLVVVNDDETTVRIWVDGKKSSD